MLNIEFLNLFCIKNDQLSKCDQHRFMNFSISNSILPFGPSDLLSSDQRKLFDSRIV